METLIKTPVQCPNVLALQQLVLALAGSVNREAVREAVMATPRFPLVSLQAMRGLLTAWQFETLAFKASTDQLRRLEGPLLAHCIWPDDEKYFVVIRHVVDEHITYYSPYTGETREPLNDFAAHWSGALLAATYEGDPDAALLNRYDFESISVAAYRQKQVRVYEEFFSADECDYLIRYAEQRDLFQRSQVEYSADQAEVSNTRTSYSAALKDPDDVVLQAINNRVANLLAVPADHIETLQCVRYGPGQQFKPHFDSGPTNFRLHTLLVYLNDDFDGGETYFPELNLKVVPHKGNALYFLNRDADDQVLLPAIHAGLPVQKGIKYGCNIWVKSHTIQSRISLEV